jgi:membrane protein DedA with SNARE-associated domain
MNMAVNDIISQYGLFAVFAGSGIEGEPFALAGGILAHRGLVPLWQAMVAASLGSCAIDQFWFFLGRYFRSHKWVVSVSKRPAFADAIDLIERRPTLFILLFRFAYGLRAIAPVAIGTSRVSVWRFVPLNILAAAIWGPIFVAIGYAFGNTLERWLPHSASTIAFIVVIVVLISALGARAALRRN